jgi:acyl-coenzyme A thioesterase PaaI-like protein
MTETNSPETDGFRPCLVRSVFPRALGQFYERREPGVGRTIRIRVEEPHCNALGVAHGGFLLTVMDFAMSYGSYDPGDFPPGITLSLTTNFLAGAPLGSWVEARVTIERASKSVLFNRCALMAGDTQVAAAQGVFKPVPLAPDPSR